MEHVIPELISDGAGNGQTDYTPPTKKSARMDDNRIEAQEKAAKYW